MTKETEMIQDYEDWLNAFLDFAKSRIEKIKDIVIYYRDGVRVALEQEEGDE